MIKHARYEENADFDMTNGMKVLIYRSIHRRFYRFHRFYAAVIGRQVEPTGRAKKWPKTVELSIDQSQQVTIDRSIVYTFVPFVMISPGSNKCPYEYRTQPVTDSWLLVAFECVQQ